MSGFQRYLNKFQKKYPVVINQETEYQSKDARFLGWQATAKGEKVALFNIINQEHPRLGSTVTEETLRHLNLQVPAVPAKPKL
jgi:hypothetical protein